MSAAIRARVTRTAAAGLLSFAFAVPAAAQAKTAPQTPARPPAREQAPPPKSPAAARPAASPTFHVTAFFEGGFETFAAKDTFDATLGKSGGAVIGGGGSLTHRSGIFVQVDVSRFTGDGERAFVHNGEVFGLGIPLQVEITPIEFTFGYKFFVNPKRPAPAPPPPPKKPFFQPARPRPGETAGTAAPKPEATRAAAPAPPAKPPFGGLKPYLGGGIGSVQYRETSEFATGAENLNERYTSYHVLGGVEVPVWRWIGAAAEVNYRWVKDAFGVAGISKEFGEDDLGGLAFRFKVTVGR